MPIDLGFFYCYIDGMNDIKYGAYRTAMKLRAIQKTTKCELV